VAFEVRVSRTIFRRVRLLVVLTAIDFNNQSRSETREIQDVIFTWHLSSEMTPEALPSA
jgi:hypothetical protein